MYNLAEILQTFLKGDDGATAVEYAVMLALILLVCIAAIASLGQTTNSTFNAPKLVNALSGS